MRLSRRALLQGGAAAAASWPALALPGRRPNLVLITVDELAEGAWPSLGGTAVHTPNLEALARRSVRFLRSYCADPACSPARASWLTGREALEHGVLLNGLPLRSGLPDLGTWLRDAGGYDTFHLGKWHVLPRETASGFTVLHEGHQIGEQGDLVTAQSAVAFLNNRRGNKPFLLSINFLNPHDICSWSRFNHVSYSPEMLGLDAAALPGLPPTFFTPAREPALLRTRKRSSLNQRTWSETVWRLYRWTYARQVEMMDGALGRVLDALALSRFAENTLVIFTSDHGELLGSHRLLGKSAPYERALGVPLLVAPPRLAAPRADADHLVSGVDLFPTLCDYAGVAPPPGLSGRSLRPIIEENNSDWRDGLGMSCIVEGRIWMNLRYKYVSFRGDGTELLFDLQADPDEAVDLAERPEHAARLAELREASARWAAGLDAHSDAARSFSELEARLSTPGEDGEDPL